MCVAYTCTHMSWVCVCVTLPLTHAMGMCMRYTHQALPWPHLHCALLSLTTPVHPAAHWMCYRAWIAAPKHVCGVLKSPPLWLPARRGPVCVVCRVRDCVCLCMFAWCVCVFLCLSVRVCVCLCVSVPVCVVCLSLSLSLSLSISLCVCVCVCVY